MATIKVISVSAIQPPFDIGVDDTGRASFSCNYAIKLNGFFKFDRAFAKYLESELYGFVDVDIFYGRVVQYPSEGHVILLIPQSGFVTKKTNDNSNITRPVLQVLVFDPQRDIAQETANDIFMKLDVMVNVNLSDD